MQVFIIAEAGVNHNGDFNTACQLIDAAVAAKADAVKFQTFKASNLVTQQAAKAAYQQASTGADENQYAMLQRLELKYEWHAQLVAYCQQHGIQFMSTAFDFESLAFLVDDLQVAQLKIPSGEITNGPFLLAHAATGKPIILSTGMATLGEIETALGVLAYGYLAPSEPPSLTTFQQAYASAAGQQLLQEKVTLLHCTSEYPSPLSAIHLRAMDVLQQAFGLRVGYSDHSVGLSVPIAAAARGACVIEKHFTLDRALKGPDHAVSLEPDELITMVHSIREVEQALGLPFKCPQPQELANQAVARKSLVATTHIAPGERFTTANISSKRPGTGISPMQYWRILEERSQYAYIPDQLL